MTGWTGSFRADAGHPVFVLDLGTVNGELCRLGAPPEEVEGIGSRLVDLVGALTLGERFDALVRVAR